jgi:DtxR family Mn-dependent transcriptional regulator
LVNVLKFNWNEVHQLAEQLEHIQSEELIRRLDEFLGYPEFDPHGDPIPDDSGKIQHHSLLLHHLNQGEEARIAGIKNHQEEFLNYLEEKGLIPGKKIRMLQKNKFEKLYEIEIEKKRIVITEKIAANLYVKKLIYGRSNSSV